MKSKMALAWFFVSLALAAALVVQWRGSEKTKNLNEKLQLQVETLDKETKTAKASTAEAQKEQSKLRGEVRALEVELNNVRAAQANAAEAARTAAATAAQKSGTGAPKPGTKQGGNPMNMLKQMMEDPAMADAMKQQQRVMMDMMYAPLFKELGLTEEESTEFKDMLLSRQMEAMDKVAGLTASDPEARKTAMEQAAADNKAFEEQLRNFLGDDRYAKYQDYNTTLGERMTLNMFAQQSNMRPEQTQQLLDLMAQEKRAYQAQNPSAVIDPNQDWQRLFDGGEAMERHFKQQEEINARVAEKAQAILAPDQLKTFTDFLANQQKLQQAGMEMARKMMANPEAAQPPEAPVAPVPAPTP